MVSLSCGIESASPRRSAGSTPGLVSQLSVTRSLGNTPFIRAGRKTTSHSRPFALCTVSSFTASRSDGTACSRPAPVSISACR